MDKFTSYIGVLLIAVGAIMLLVSYFSANLMDTNWFDALGIGIMIVGLFVHAFKVSQAVWGDLRYAGKLMGETLRSLPH